MKKGLQLVYRQSNKLEQLEKNKFLKMKIFVRKKEEQEIIKITDESKKKLKSKRKMKKREKNASS